MLDAKGGEGPSMLDLGGACEMDSIIWSFVCDTSCIHFYFHALYYIHVMVTYVTCVLSILIYIYICHVTLLWLCSFALLPHYTPIQISFTLCTRAYYIYCEYIMLAWVI